MHYTVIVAIPGTVAPGDVSSYLATAIDAHAEHDGAEWPGLGEWDWWGVGGHRRGMFRLTSDAESRRRAGKLELPIDTDFHLGGFLDRQLHYYDAIARIRSVFPVVVDNACEPLLANQTDCARVRDIEPQSVSVPSYWIQLDGRLCDLELEEADTRRFHGWFQTLPIDTWLINVDAHR